MAEPRFYWLYHLPHSSEYTLEIDAGVRSLPRYYQRGDAFLERVRCFCLINYSRRRGKIANARIYPARSPTHFLLPPTGSFAANHGSRHDGSKRRVDIPPGVVDH